MCVLVHAVWSTKYRVPFLKKGKKREVISIIRQIAEKHGVSIHAIDGGEEHLHCAFELPSNLSLQGVIKYFKGGSSFQINKTKILGGRKFQWAKGYYAETISYHELSNVVKYIENQEEHHRKLSFREEWANLVQEICPENDEQVRLIDKRDKEL